MTVDANEQDTVSPAPTGAPGDAGRVLRWFAIPHLLSLDAPVVAVVWARLFADSLNLNRLFPGVYLMLFCSVWAIYLGDRLLDTAPWKEKISGTARHRFFRERWWALLLLSLLPGGCVVWLAAGDVLGGAYAVPSGIVVAGVVLSGLVCLYYLLRLTSSRYVNAIAIACLGGAAGLLVLSLVHLPFAIIVGSVVLLILTSGRCLFVTSVEAIAFPRELLCGVVFALGTVMPVYSHVSDSFVFGLPAEIFADGRTLFNLDTVLLAMLCVLNCVGISIWEKTADSDGNDPQALAQYAPGVEQQFPIMASLIGLVSVALIWDASPGLSGTWKIKLAVALSAFSLMGIHAFRGRLHPLASRILADVMLLWPLVLLPLP
ncbi:MAG: hypothetical protein KDN22_31780 [Verrucomicrobiae bacterium]|nr:hypothetical protein [Verrucomicrobiae bacterium]